MAILLSCRSIAKHYGTRDLFRNLSISFDDREHVGFLGPNGAGKTTFFKILAGLVAPDEGEVSRRRGLRVRYLPQEDRFDDGQTVESVLDAALAAEAIEPHERHTRVQITISKFAFSDAHQTVEQLSGGWRKRLAIAREVIREPDLLLLDEPTNHLDVEAIEDLEELLASASFSFLAISHDRYFLENVTNRVVELNPIYPDGYFSASGAYSAFIEKRAEFQQAQLAQQASLANIVRREAAFLRSNSKAQRTKSKARIEEAYRLHDELKELQDRNERATAAGIDFEGTGRKSRKLLDVRGAAKSLGERLLFRDVSTILSPGTRLGILGSNGSGKTTLTRVLTGDLPPDAGSVTPADDLRVVVFDQRREQLSQDMPLREALAGRHDTVVFEGRPVHISSWSRRFLFRPDQLDVPVGELSGGEQARIFIARLMLRPADVLILDEPTNDLDIESLEVLEQSLMDFPGAVVLVTHDRFMLDRVCTEILALDGDGRVSRYGTCGQWLAARAAAAQSSPPAERPRAKPRPATKALSASERSELRNMESTIHTAEQEVERCRLATEDPQVGADHVEAQKRWEALDAAQRRVNALYARWEELEGKARES